MSDDKIVMHSPVGPLTQVQLDEIRAGRAARAAETAALQARLADPHDAYDAHHGNDRSAASLEHAQSTNPELGEHILQNILTEDRGD